MCVVSMVFDHYQEPFKQWTGTNLPDFLKPTSPEVLELRQLIAEFREALKAAKTVDKLTGQPDCEDPKKATLEERVAALERALAGREWVAGCG